jgi:hypothetical protein
MYELAFKQMMINSLFTKILVAQIISFKKSKELLTFEGVIKNKS